MLRWHVPAEHHRRFGRWWREPPNWPDITHVDDVVRPFMWLLAACAMAFGPAIMQAYGPMLLNGIWGTSFGQPNPTLTKALIAGGLVYLPMAILSTAMFQTIQGLNPLRVIAAIIKVAPCYVVVLGIIAVAGTALTALFRYVHFIPFVGEFILLYLVMALGRILGLIYWTRSTKLNWFPRGDRDMP